jgi:hypothetical protein
MNCQSKIRIVVVWGLLLSTLLCVCAPIVRAEDPCEYARAAGAERSSGCLWYTVGCALPILGVIGSYLITPDPPTAALVGKGPSYIDTYVDCYKGGARSVQAKWAWIGCGCGVLLGIPITSCLLGLGSWPTYP